MSKKYKKVCTALHFIEHLLILPSAVTGYVSISAFASLVGIPIGIKGSALGLKNCVTTIGVKKYNSIIKKKRKKHDEMVLLAKTKLKSTEILISRVLIDSYISHDEFVSVNNVLKEYDIKKQSKTKKPQQFLKDLNLFTKQSFRDVWKVEKKQKIKTPCLQRQIKEN